MIGRGLVVAAVSLAAAWIIGNAERSAPHTIRAPLAALPRAITAWRGRDEPLPDARTLAVLGADDVLNRSYAGPAPVALFVGYWASQREGDTIHSPLNCLPGSGWEPVSKRPLPVTVRGGDDGRLRSIVINRYLVAHGLDRELVLYWYQSHGRVVASEYASKWYLVSDALRLHRTDAALVRVSIRVGAGDPDGSRATAAATRFVEGLFPVLDPVLPS